MGTGRPRKNNADWFKHFNNLQNQQAVRVLRKKFSNTGYCILMYLWENICGTAGFEIDFDIKNKKYYCAEYEVSMEQLEAIVALCVEWELLALNDDNTRLSSPYLNDAFAELISYREKDRNRKNATNFPTENQSFPAENDSIPTDNNSFPAENSNPTEKRSFPAENDSIPTEKEVFLRKSTQSRVRVEDISLRSISPPSPPTTTPSPACDISPVTADIAVEMLKTDRNWLLQMQRRHGIKSDSVTMWLDSFACDCDCRGKQQHENLADVKQHFNDWLAKQLIRKAAKPGKGASQRDGRQDGQPKQDYSHRWIQCQAELCRSVSVQESAATFEQMRFKSFLMQDGVPTLCVQIPSQDVYERLEKLHVSLMQRVITKYFGSFRLQYELTKTEN